MTHLYESIATAVDAWRQTGYQCVEYPVIAEILHYQVGSETETPSFLRKPQLRALETYWYLRLIQKTPHVLDLYTTFFSNKSQRRQALGISNTAFEAAEYDFDTLLNLVKTDNDFVRTHKFDALRETLTLNYPSYILALAMGAGKTILMGAIIATEFAMALEYPKTAYPQSDFVENALVFAPGKTILESLRELMSLPYDRILPPRLFTRFVPNLKLTFTRDGEKDVPIIRGSSFNVVVTNTEKIRITKETIKSSLFKGLLAGLNDTAKGEVANLRLQTIASLPHLAVFSDEAHHTYGQSLGNELKRVRQTVDYLAANTNLVCVVNTTGTPYYERQMLKDVVVWYGLAEGIADGILKEVKDGVQAYRFDEENTATFVSEVVRDFLQDYGTVRLPNGAPAKIALYFPQTDDLDEMRPVIEQAVHAAGYLPTIVLRNTDKSSKDEEDAFNRLNDPDAPHRIILLVNKGTEGWNCPSLFACALIRSLKKSNNFVLQAATRCLRQVSGNTHHARIYISADNRKALNDQLEATYGEGTTLDSLDRTATKQKSVTLTLKKFNIAPLYITVPVTVIRRKPGLLMAIPTMQLSRPVTTGAVPVLERTRLQFDMGLKESGMSDEIVLAPQTSDSYSVAVQLAARYRLDSLPIRQCLAEIYGDDDIPDSDIPALAAQLEARFCDYEQQTVKTKMTLALVRLSGWKVQPDGTYISTATYKDSDEHLIVDLRTIEENPSNFGYHYAPYRFSSTTEVKFFQKLLDYLKTKPGEIDDVYFTGGLTSETKTDFYIGWTDTHGKHHNYFPDFLIRKKPAQGEPDGSGACLIVEIKSSQHRNTIEAELKAGNPASAMTDEARKTYAALHWVGLNSDGTTTQLNYELVFDNQQPILSEAIIRFLEGIQP